MNQLDDSTLEINPWTKEPTEVEEPPVEKAYNPDQPRVPAGNENGGQFASEDGSGHLFAELKGKVNNETFPPSVVLDEGVTLYTATSDPHKIKRVGLMPKLPTEVDEDTEDSGERKSTTGVYLGTKELANRYLNGRLGGEGGIVSVWLPEGTTVYQDPVDIGAVFVRDRIPGYGIEVEE